MHSRLERHQRRRQRRRRRRRRSGLFAERKGQLTRANNDNGGPLTGRGPLVGRPEVISHIAPADVITATDETASLYQPLKFSSLRASSFSDVLTPDTGANRCACMFNISAGRNNSGFPFLVIFNG